jgi:hypothetical protein
MTGATTFACAQCGSAVPRSAQFCLVCGTPVSSRNQAAPAPSAVPAAAVPAAEGWRPAPAATPIHSSELVPVHYGRRVLAFVVDGVFGTVLWLLVVLPLIAAGVIQLRATATTVQFTGLSAVLLLVPLAVYPLAMLLLQAFAGFSLGKLLLGLRIVRFGRFTRPGLGAMIVRALVVGAASLVLGLGQYVVWLSPLWDGTRLGRGWHDRLAGTWVIDVKRGPNPLKALPGQLVVDRAAAVAAPAPAVAPPGGPVPAPGASAAAWPPAAPPTAPPAWPAAPAAPAAPITGVPGFAPAAAASLAGAAGDPDVERTRMGGAPPPVRTPQPLAFRFDDGRTVPVTGHGALGRAPVAPGASGASGDDGAALLIPLDGDTLSVSKTHLEFGVDRDGVWVSDRGSKNGTAIVRGDGLELDLDPGERVTVLAGDRVRVGERVFAVVAAGSAS